MSNFLKKLQELGLVQLAKEQFPPPTSKQGEPAHALSRHTPIWSYCPPGKSRPFVKSYRKTPLYAILPHSASVTEVTSNTHFICLFGATGSAVMDELETSPAVKIVFEPDTDKALEYIRSKELGKLVKNKFFFFIGDFRSNGWDLDGLVPEALTDLGFPTMYIQKSRETYADYFQEIIKRLEFLYFRNKIVPAIGQQGSRGTPYRPLHKRLFYDQQRHLFENIMHLVTGGNPRHFENIQNGTAVLIGAGPGLKRRTDLARNPGNALTIAVNSAYGFCHTNGISPDITLISDTSIQAGQSLLGWNGTNDGILLGHWASGLGDAHFKKRYVGWEFYPEVFGERPEPETYGSVISAALGVADLIGIEQCVMTGFHMATDIPQGFSYASGEKGKYYSEEEKRHPDYKYPDLYPVTGADGSTLFTSLNFYDATMMLLDYIRNKGIQIINTAPDSIICGEGITVDPDYTLPTSHNRSLPRQFTEIVRDPINLSLVDSTTGEWLHFWQDIHTAAADIAGKQKPGAQELITAEKMIAEYDGNNVSYLLQRFDTFSNHHFHRLFFGDTSARTRLEGAVYYFEHLERMAHEFISIIENQRLQLHALMKTHGNVY